MIGGKQVRYSDGWSEQDGEVLIVNRVGILLSDVASKTDKVHFR